ncbi:DUF1014-domain-containing protein [Exidia glandulosa HHB12029]|uniref:DUF1014-domain-containing protein n=1 Tax=Exidia glandulosa HHB12029 TaxID=1314781 RepID=A0A165GNT8_EXIGL|nr:DUF1014-domain-containing protein [Exidia glandulosa HHB12029]
MVNVDSLYFYFSDLLRSISSRFRVADASFRSQEKKEAASWDDGAKKASAKKVEAEDKRKAELARKAEAARLLAEEEAALPAKKAAAPKAGKKAAQKPTPKPAGPGALAAGGGLAALSDDKGKSKDDIVDDEPVSLSATGIDSALEMLDLVNAKADKASVGQQAAGIERHPERRFKAAFEAYQERELPNAKKEHPGLRLQQYKDLLYKQFQKSPENPFNQVTVSYDASKEEKVSALEARNKQAEERLRERTKNLTLDD